MPIYGLSTPPIGDDDSIPVHRPTILGKLWVGTPKSEGNRDLKTCFRFEPRAPWVKTQFLEHYGSLKPEKVNFYFVYPDTDSAWYCRREKRGPGAAMLERVCNNLWVEKEQVLIPMKDSKGKTIETPRMKFYKENEKPCPYANPHNDPNIPDCPECGRIGTLSIFIKELYDNGVQGMVMLDNPSKNNIATLSGHLRSKEMQLRSHGGNLCEVPVVTSNGVVPIRVPWILERHQASTTMPAPNGGRQRKTFYPFTCNYDPAWWQMMEEYWQRQYERSLAAAANLQLPAPHTLTLPSAPPLIQQEPPMMPIAAMPTDTNFPTIEEMLGEAGEEELEGEFVDDSETAELQDEFLPIDKKNSTNADRLYKVTDALGIPRKEATSLIGAMMATIYPGKHSSQLQSWHVNPVVDGILQTWVISQTKNNGEPIALNEVEAYEKFNQAGIQSSWDDNRKIQIWKKFIEDRR